MTDDARGLLAAIVADPADDTARLAYADCIEERGNAARAEFIRKQIEAERLHPDSNARAQLESRAEALFAQHWLDWWSEVCEVTGLPIPAHSPATRLGRLARRVGLGTPRGDPYQLTGVGVRAPSRRPIDGWHSAIFHRGFPDRLHVAVPVSITDNLLRATLSLWFPEFPIASLIVTNPTPWGLTEKPFAGVRALTLLDYDRALIRGVLQSPMFPNLEDLTLRSNEYADGQGVVEEFANQVANAVRLLRDRRLKRLSLQVWTDAAATAVAEAPHLASLTALEVDIAPDTSLDQDGAARRLATLARSPHLAGLNELTVKGRVNVEACLHLGAGATWAGLQKLSIRAWLEGENLAALLASPTLRELDELQLGLLWLNRQAIDLVIRSLLVKQLRHFAITGCIMDDASDTDLRRLPEMFDLERIETFRLSPDHQRRGLNELWRQLGDRLRMP